METEWTTTDIELKTDTAAVLECLQRSMADDDDDEFMLYNHTPNSEFVPSLPPVSELRADLSTYYDRNNRQEVQERFVNETTDPRTSHMHHSYEHAPNNHCTSGSQFTTLTNANSSQHFPMQYYHDHQAPPYSSYQGSNSYYQDYPHRQSSLIPTDLQQVTPTIQDLGTPIVTSRPIDNGDYQTTPSSYFQPPTIQNIGTYDETPQPRTHAPSVSQTNQHYVTTGIEQSASNLPHYSGQHQTQTAYQDAGGQYERSMQSYNYPRSEETFTGANEVQSSIATAGDGYGASGNIQTTSATQMLHDALEYIAPEVVTENRDSLFNPIAALTNTLLENNFDVQPQEQDSSYGYRYDHLGIMQEEQPQEVPKELRKKDLPKLLDIIKVYRCKACGFRSSDKLKAIRHTIESHSRPKLDRKARYACGTCHSHFATLESCGKHIGEKHAALNTAVLKDGKLFKQLLIEPKRKAKIRLDSESQTQKIAWKRKLNRDQGVFVCEFRGCSIRFRADDTHRYHLRCHLPHPSEDEKFHCPVLNCKQGTKLWGTLANHLWNEHHIDIELQACNRCDFKTYSLSNLEKVHKLVHSEEKQFECDECHSKFRTIKQLRNHKYYTHSETTRSEEYRKSKMDSCPQCGQTMMKKNLKSHMEKVHEGRQVEKSCQHCDFHTNSVSQLKSHMKIHLGARAMYCCEQCGFLTPDHNIHRKHMAQHSGDKPYKCRWCAYASIQASTYKQHVKRQHPEKADELILRCSLCPFETISEERLRQHNNKMHL